MSASERFLYLVAGTGVGAIMGLLFAPRAGTEIRTSLAGQAQRGVDLINEKVEEGKKFIQEKRGTGGTVTSMADRGRQEFTESSEGVRNRFNEPVDTGIGRRGEGAL
jgi:gas vesicle protein